MQQADLASIIAGSVPAPGNFDPFTEYQGREMIEALIQGLIDVLNVFDGDADSELNGDEAEDCEGQDFVGMDGNLLCSIPFCTDPDMEDDEYAAGCDNELREWWR